ncbi:SET domain-containing protein [Hypoxylon fragiforme]|uniref:SET domain-containing protein n=1 Tax=Hypoxylon fragiforme TaxID=63214 RepID=UPI0020C67E7D|nr:SET domain-containing protein [Hypoxylon fragiforme]KAI2603566.1 SET domain-containing protein [Hypoxylon fragiforme]
MRPTTVLYSSLAALSGVKTVKANDVGPETTCPSTPFPRAEEQICASPELLSATRAKGVEAAAYWEGPQHCVGETCVFANPHIGDGIVLVTSERNARAVRGFPVASASPAAPTAPPPFHATHVPGKGIGVVADRHIQKGETLLVRTPTLLVQTAPHVELDPGARDALYEVAVDKLPRPGYELFMGQMGEGVYGKVETNCFQLVVKTHNPNSVHYRIANTTHTTVAARAIAPGEELSISYIALLLPRAERRSRLRRWGFSCTCAQCLLSHSPSPLSTASDSDSRVAEILALEAALEVFNETVVTADTGARLVELYQLERLDVYLGQAYTRAALNYALFGEEEKARVYAGMAVEALEREDGGEGADARAMRGLVEDPRGHWTWGRRRRGRGKVA